jgi:hypothetical protein
VRATGRQVAEETTGMSCEEAWNELAHECPRKILGLLHAKGLYVHGTSARFPGKVLCFHKDSPRPDDWQPTPAQERAWQEAQQDPPAAHG